MTILIDVDNTFWNFGERLLDFLNISNNTHYKFTDINHWNWYQEHFDHPFDVTETAWFWSTVTPYLNAVEVIEQFVRDGHKVAFVTASGFTNGLAPKINRLLSFFDPKLINQNNIIVAKDKSLINGDILIDDALHNLDTFPKMTIQYIQPWNVSDKNYCEDSNGNPYIDIDTLDADGYAENWDYVKRVIIDLGKLLCLGFYNKK